MNISFFFEGDAQVAFTIVTDDAQPGARATAAHGWNRLVEIPQDAWIEFFDPTTNEQVGRFRAWAFVVPDGYGMRVTWRGCVLATAGNLPLDAKDVGAVWLWQWDSRTWVDQSQWTDARRAV